MTPGPDFALTRRALMQGALIAPLLAPAARAESGLRPAKRPGPPPAADPALAALVAQVSRQRLRADVTALSAFPTRWTLAPDFPAVEEWMAAAFLATGAAPEVVTRQAYTTGSGLRRHNILCGDPLSGRRVILVGAHVDSISEQPALLAPGANDNATGIAAMLEARRLLSALTFEREIVCVAFSGEEQGLEGSAFCSATARREGWPVDLMVNLDMLGHRPDDPAAPLYIEYDQGNAVAANDGAARGYGLMAARMAAAHSTLAVAHTDIWDSDYMPFEAAGFACIGLYDGGVESPRYHSSTDTAEAVDFARLEQAVRLLVATLATAAA